MGITFSSIFNQLFGKKDMRILMVGLDAAGRNNHKNDNDNFNNDNHIHDDYSGDDSPLHSHSKTNTFEWP